tara:strand:+ start:263 stop:1096 length:834 start_codon:yes stop_codon:yes gene_type:complete
MNYLKKIICFNLFLLTFVIQTKAKEGIQQKIVTLTSLSSDLLNVISPESLVGVSGSKIIKNNKAFKDKVFVTEGRNPPDLEKIISLKPNLVIGSKGFHDKALSKLNSLGIKTISTEIRNWEDLEELNNKLTKFIGKDSNDLSTILNDCYPKNKNIRDEIVVLATLKPLVSPNSRSWSGSLLRRFNFNNLTSDLDSKSAFRGYVNLSPEWLISNNPSKIIIVNYPSREKTSLQSLPFWRDLKAIKENKVYSFDYYGLINPGSLNSINQSCKKLSSINF